MSNKKKLGRAKLRAVIIGAGGIASGFDNPNDSSILTHAHAYKKHKQVELAGFFDIDKKAANLAAKKWRAKSFVDMDQMFKKINPDLVSVCTPDNTHKEVLEKIARYGPGLVICEKPVTILAQNTEEIIELYKNLNISILVDFSRRFDATMQDLKKDIEKNKFGKVISASGIYNKGIKHNGSHLIDLALYLFGEAVNLKAFYCLEDYASDDKSVAGFLQFVNCPQFHLQIFDQRKYSIFEMDILFEKSRIRLVDFGFKILSQKVEKNPLYAGYYSLSKEARQKTKLDKALLNLVDNAILHIQEGAPLICSINEALKTQKVCEQLLIDLKV